MPSQREGFVILPVLAVVGVSIATIMGAVRWGQESQKREVATAALSAFDSQALRVQRVLRNRISCSAFLGNLLPVNYVRTLSALNPVGALDPESYPVERLKVGSHELLRAGVRIAPDLVWAQAGNSSDQLRFTGVQRVGAPVRFGALTPEQVLQDQASAASGWRARLELVAKRNQMLSRYTIHFRFFADVQVNSGAETAIVDSYTVRFTGCEAIDTPAVPSDQPVSGQQVCTLLGGTWVEPLLASNGTVLEQNRCIRPSIAVASSAQYPAEIYHNYGSIYKTDYLDDGGLYVGGKAVLTGRVLGSTQSFVREQIKVRNFQSGNLFLSINPSDPRKNIKTLAPGSYIGCPPGSNCWITGFKTGVGAQDGTSKAYASSNNKVRIVTPPCPAGQYIRQITASGLRLSTVCEAPSVPPTPTVSAQCAQNQVLKGIQNGQPVCAPRGSAVEVHSRGFTGSTGVLQVTFTSVPRAVIVNVNQISGSEADSTWTLRPGQPARNMVGHWGSQSISITGATLNGSTLSLNWATSNCSSPRFSLLGVL